MGQLHKPAAIVAQRYCILDTLGEGGSGITYRAKDLQAKRQVALKALSLRQSKSWDNLDRFEREARILAQLEHPAIPRYLDYFKIESDREIQFYIVQQLAEGESLETWVNKGWHATEREVRNIAEQILEILIYLHSLNPPIAHRDIKPQNIIRNADGRVFLVDFGAVQEIYHSAIARSMTVAGTFGYMAPEQFIGQACPQSDLYGLGTTLLFLLTHRSPADLPAEQVKLKFRNYVQISETFADFIEKLLEPELKNRFSSAKEALAALRAKKPLYLATYPAQRSPQKVVFGLIATAIFSLFLFEAFKYPLMSFLGFTPAPFYTAIRDNDLETTKYFLKRGIRPNTYDMQNSSPLHWAVSNNSIEVASLLIKWGAEVNDRYNIKLKDNHTVLHISVQHNAPEMTELLLDSGATINAISTNGMTPLHYAVLKPDRFQYYGMDMIQPEPSPEILTLLIAKGAEINARDSSGKTPLDYARSQGYAKAVTFLEQQGAR